MGRGKRLTAEEIGNIKCLREEGYSNREIARRIHRSAKVVNNFVQDIENYGKKL
jgi:IS30 family transposase